ncbi:MAG: hypothetical protein RBT42_11990 [Aquabacterium sp.]|jgi:hypothetical protein|uniref:hypothetical protein n=1 Tax=Aquabacterium sp. TaxID=1872578 RepID=UPI002A36D827|nr:hypothetical protein [Aquabacterium sp.]MDX9844466.1 hypothetical protein [Aquabacterium sp.]
MQILFFLSTAIPFALFSCFANAASTSSVSHDVGDVYQPGLSASTNPQQMRERWGDFMHLAGKSWLHRAAFTKDHYALDFQWVKPNSEMRIAFAWCDKPECLTVWTVRYNQDNKRIEFISKSNETEKIGKVQADGSIKTSYKSWWSGSETWKYDPSGNTFTLNRGLNSLYEYKEVSDAGLLNTVKTLMMVREATKDSRAIIINEPNGVEGRDGSVSVKKPIAPEKIQKSGVEAAGNLSNGSPSPSNPPSRRRYASKLNWSAPSCSDAGYGGRPAIRCVTRADSDTDSARVTIWATTDFFATLQMTTKALARHVQIQGFQKQLTDRFELKIDGRSVRSIPPSELIFTSIDLSGRSTTVEFRLSESEFKEMASGAELTLVLVGQDGSPIIASLPLSSVLGDAAAKGRALYSRLFSSGKNPLKPDVASLEIWGPLGEAADRSRYWTLSGDREVRMIDLQWLKPAKELQVRLGWCNAESCGRYTWKVLALTGALVNGNFDQVVLALVDEYGKVHKRVDQLKRHNGDYMDKEQVFLTFDPVLVRDFEYRHAQFSNFATMKDPCCMMLDIDPRYRPASADAAERLFADYQARLERARQQKILEVEAERERITRQTDSQMPKLDENGRVDRGPDVVPMPAPMSFMESLQRDLLASRAREASQARFVAQLQDRMRETAKHSRAKPTVESHPESNFESIIGNSRMRQSEMRPDRELQSDGRIQAPESSASMKPMNSIKSSASQRESAMLRTVEAIMVCTRPNHSGHFECDSPVDTNIKGGPGTLTQWETPEKMVSSMSGGCPAPRRLPSTTHLVWGCGFAATNNSNSMDRSAGVDVRDRKFYYCLERQTGCRRTEP